MVDILPSQYNTWADVWTANARKGLFEMTDEHKVKGESWLAEHMVERVKLLEEKLRAANEVRKGRRRGKQEREPRALARKGREWSVLIAIRSRLVRVHARGGFEGTCLTTNDLLDLHREQGGLCRYTGLPYEFDREAPLSVTVDRLDHLHGWTRENVVLCCLFSSVARNGWPLELVVPLWRFLPTTLRENSRTPEGQE